MKHCTNCEGFVPHAHSECPNCGYEAKLHAQVEQVKRWSLTSLSLSLALGLAASCTPMMVAAVYGAPVPLCEADQTPEEDGCFQRNAQDSEDEDAEESSSGDNSNP